MEVMNLSYNPAGDEEPLWAMKQRQCREQAILLEQQLEKQKKKIISENIKKKKILSANAVALGTAVVIDAGSSRMGTRTRERNANLNSTSPLPPSRWYGEEVSFIQKCRN